MTYNTDVIKM